VGGTMGGAALARDLGRTNLICVDMGGTSFDVSLIISVRPTVSTETELEGLPLLVPLVDIHTIGAGGGSIAWLEAGGLRVGPRSAGADPGPACYARGGTEPTVTDANLVLGRLDPSHFLGGEMSLDGSASRAALRPISEELGLNATTLAEGIVAIVNASMADAIRTITVKRGIDPREFGLVAFGGAGPMHAVALAEELGIREVVVPWSPGTFSAWGMLQTDIRHDLALSFFHSLGEVLSASILEAVGRLESEGTALLAADGVPADEMSFSRSADLRYVGQEYVVNVPLTEDLDATSLAEGFHAAHHARHGHATPDVPVELVNLRLTAIGKVARAPIAVEPRTIGGGGNRREVVFGGTKIDTPAVLRGTLRAGERHRGPVIVEDDSATLVVPPGWEAQVDPGHTLFVVPLT
jgi:N-methylhydantoinase A